VFNVLKCWMLCCSLNSCASGLGSVAFACEHGDEPSDYAKSEEFDEPRLLRDVS
jgi:hypothetical protein